MFIKRRWMTSESGRAYISIKGVQFANTTHPCCCAGVNTSTTRGRGKGKGGPEKRGNNTEPPNNPRDRIVRIQNIIKSQACVSRNLPVGDWVGAGVGAGVVQTTSSTTRPPLSSSLATDTSSLVPERAIAAKVPPTLSCANVWLSRPTAAAEKSPPVDASRWNRTTCQVVGCTHQASAPQKRKSPAAEPEIYICRKMRKYSEYFRSFY